jgi:hypothetical protein
MTKAAIGFAVLALAGAACSGGGGGGGSPTSPPPPTSPAGSATFTLSGAGYDQTVSYDNASGSLIFCRPNGTRWWVRLVAQSAGNGGSGPHVDIDLCNYSGSGVFAPMDPNAGCGGGMTWDIYWHDSSQGNFVNQATSSPCTLALTLMGASLDGVFSCRSLVELGGTRTLDVLNGTFHCTV